jgi:hypothetical protein
MATKDNASRDENWIDQDDRVRGRADEMEDASPEEDFDDSDDLDEDDDVEEGEGSF